MTCTALFVILMLVLLVLVPNRSNSQAKQRPKCPRRCQCFTASVPNGMDVDCSSKKLTDLPTVPKNTITLVMQHNQLLQILPRSFARNKRLQNLYLYRNNIRRVHWDAFQGLKNLQVLSLFDNRITKINNGTFKDLTSLKKLYLYQNRIKSLNKQSFVGLSSLETLSLRDNDISEIERGTFSQLARLDSLFLFRNNLTKLTHGMFEGLRSLRTLIIGLNRISEIENGAFRGLSRLTELYIDNNKLDRVTSRMFADLTSLKRLHIYNNAIKTIDPGSFFRLREMVFLAAHHNKINQISAGAFAGLLSLKALHLQANRIAQIDSKSFADLKSLRTLYLYQNKLKLILRDAFVGLEDLRELHLGFNVISEIQDGAFTELKKLTTLYLDSNKLPRISKGTLAGLSSLLDLYVYFNQISFVENNAFIQNKFLRYIAWDVPRQIRDRQRYRNIPGNLLFCDCHARYLKRWLSRHPTTQVSCHQPETLRGVSITKLTKTDFEKCHEPRIQTEPANATLKAGSRVNFYCKGTPVAEFMWYKNGSRILPKPGNGVAVSSFGTLSLTSVKQSDEGLYVCVAKSKKSFSVSTVQLNVGRPPYFATNPQSTQVTIGSKIILRCRVAADPPAQITWYKGRQEISLDEERVLQTVKGTLVILDARPGDEGTYSCRAWNQLDDISMDVDVVIKQEKVHPSTPVPCSPTTSHVEDIDISGSGSGQDDDDDDGSSSGNDDDTLPRNTTMSPISLPTSSR